MPPWRIKLWLPFILPQLLRFFYHAAYTIHGDLSMIQNECTVPATSNENCPVFETKELPILLSWSELQIQDLHSLINPPGPDAFGRPVHKKNRFGIINKADL